MAALRLALARPLPLVACRASKSTLGQALNRLLRHLPAAGAEGLREPPMTAQELALCTLRKVALQILHYEAAYVGEADTGWFELGRRPRIGFKLLRNVPTANEGAEPAALREAFELLESNRWELTRSPS